MPPGGNIKGMPSSLGGVSVICIVRFVYASYQENMFTRVPPEPRPSPVRAPSEPRPSPVRASPEYSPERVFPDGICYVCLRHTTGGRLGDSTPSPAARVISRRCVW